MSDFQKGEKMVKKNLLLFLQCKIDSHGSTAKVSRSIGLSEPLEEVNKRMMERVNMSDVRLTEVFFLLGGGLTSPRWIRGGWVLHI